MKKVILEEIENMKYLLGYKRGVVISEQEEKNDMIDKYSSKSISNSIDSGNYGNLDPKVADVIKQAQNALGGQSVLTNPTTTGAPTTGAQAAGAQAAGAQASGATTPPTSTAPVTPIKIGVKYPDIQTLQKSLNTKNQAGLNDDGKYGPKTAASVLAALQKLPVNSTETKTTNSTTSNTTDQNAETLKKTAEANASNNVVKTNDQNKDTKQSVGGTNFPEEDINEYI
jgi:hypothetical protein